MPTNVTWDGVSYAIPNAGELNWASLTNFLVALGTKAAVAEEMKQAIRVATTTPVTVVAASDFAVVVDLSVAGPSAVSLPAGSGGQVFVIVDGKGDAATNNITITPNGLETIAGSASVVLNKNRQVVMVQYHAATSDWKLLDYSLPIGGVTPGDLTGVIPANKGGTGIANNAAATLTRSGNHDLAITTTAPSAVTMPTAGTLATLAGTETLSNKTLVAPKIDDAGTGDLVVTSSSGLTADKTLTIDVNDANRTLDMGGDIVTGGALTTTPANDVTLTTTGATNVTLPTTGTLATLAGAEVFTNKDIDGGTASNSRRITLPKDTYANLLLLTRKEGTLLYATDQDVVYYDDGSSIVPVGSGSGQGEVNYIENPSAALNLDGWATTDAAEIDVERTTTASELPREPLTSAGIKITPITGTTEYVYTRFTLGDADKGKLLKIQWAQKALSGYVAGDLVLEMWTNTQSDYLGTYTQLTVQSPDIPAGDVVLLTTFASTTADYYELRIRRAAGTTAIVLQDVVVGPGSLASVPNITDLQPYTPIFTGFGTPSSVNFECGIVGPQLVIKGRFTSGVPTAVPNEISLPSGYTIKSSLGSPVNLGKVTLDENSTEQYHVLGLPGGSTFFLSKQSLSFASFQHLDADALLVNDSPVTLEITVPVNELSSNIFSTQTAVEYAYNSDTSDADDTTSFAWGQGGVLVPNANAQRTKRIRFQTPRLPTDVIDLQLMDPSGQWSSATDQLYGPAVNSTGTPFGYYLDWSTVSDPTREVNVVFQQYVRPGGTTNWSILHSSGLRWRVVKSSNPISVGHDLVGQNKSGLVQSAGQLNGTNTDDDADAGNVGEYLEDTYSGLSYGTGGVWVDAAQLTLTPGDWDITHQNLYDTQGTGVTVHSQLMGISVNSGNSFTDFTDGDTAARQSHPSSTTYSSACVTVRKSIAATTTFYAKVRAENVASPDPSFSGKMFARRSR